MLLGQHLLAALHLVHQRDHAVLRHVLRVVLVGSVRNLEQRAVVRLHPERDVGAVHDVAPEAAPQHGAPLLAPFRGGAQRAVGNGRVGQVDKPVADGEGVALLPPVAVLPRVDDGGHLDHLHVVVPVQHVLPRVVARAVQLAQPLVAVVLHVPRHVLRPGLEHVLQPVALLVLHGVDAEHVLPLGAAGGDERDELGRRRLHVVGRLVPQEAVAEDLEEQQLPLPQRQRLVQRDVEQQQLPRRQLELLLHDIELELARRVAPVLRDGAQDVAHVALAGHQHAQRSPAAVAAGRLPLAGRSRRWGRVLQVDRRREAPEGADAHALQRHLVRPGPAEP
eukprot:COSAG04_NODE_1255_length_7540_cov_2.717108_4_plen_335_part_00